MPIEWISAETAALRVIERVGQELADDAIRPLDEAEVDRRAQLGTAILADIAAVDSTSLAPDTAISLALAEHAARRMSKEAALYWLTHDIGRTGLFSVFGPTGMGGGFIVNYLAGGFMRKPLERAGDADRYLGALSDFTDWITAMRSRLVGQAERGIVMPRLQIPTSAAMMRDFLRTLPPMLIPDPARHRSLPNSAQFADRCEALVQRGVLPAVASIAELLEGPYADRAPASVGMAQYPGGAAAYAQAVKDQTTLDLSAEEIHERAQRRLTFLKERMAAIRAEARFAGTDREYSEALDRNPAWRARGAEDIAARFDDALRRIQPTMESQFRFKPKAIAMVAAMPDALAEAMPYGFYTPPAGAGAPGVYLFHPANLSREALIGIPLLTFHELVPGHHVHLASQIENHALPELRRRSFFAAFAEGWAEYSVTLAQEQGLFLGPEEQFGFCKLETLPACTAIIDTGLNALGWSVEKARAFMQDNAFQTENEALNWCLNVSCAIPAHAVAYTVGQAFMIGERDRARAALGRRFDPSDFHDAILRPGGLPLPLVARNIDRLIADTKSRAA